MSDDFDGSTQRLDIWLWTARFYKTRALSAAEVDCGRIEVNGQSAKRGKPVRPGDQIGIRRPGEPVPQVMTVMGLARTRGPAALAQTLYLETPASIAARAAHRDAVRLAPEPATTQLQGRPTKRHRRELGAAQSRWQRWSASIDNDD